MIELLRYFVGMFPTQQVVRAKVPTAVYLRRPGNHLDTYIRRRCDVASQGAAALPRIQRCGARARVMTEHTLEKATTEVASADTKRAMAAALTRRTGTRSASKRRRVAVPVWAPDSPPPSDYLLRKAEYLAIWQAQDGVRLFSSAFRPPRRRWVDQQSTG